MTSTPTFARAAVAAVAIAATVGAPAASAGDIVARRDGSKAVYVPPPPPAATSPGTGGDFHLDDAGVGAAGMLAVVLASAGVATLHGRRRSSRPLEAVMSRPG